MWYINSSFLKGLRCWIVKHTYEQISQEGYVSLYLFMCSSLHLSSVYPVQGHKYNLEPVSGCTGHEAREQSGCDADPLQHTHVLSRAMYN